MKRLKRILRLIALIRFGPTLLVAAIKAFWRWLDLDRLDVAIGLITAGLFWDYGWSVAAVACGTIVLTLEVMKVILTQRGK